MRSCHVRIRTTRPADWVTVFGRLRSLVIRVDEAQLIFSGHAGMLATPNCRLRSLRLTVNPSCGTPDATALVGSLLAALQLEEFGCDCHDATKTIIDGA